jgi:hypothetical protein
MFEQPHEPFSRRHGFRSPDPPITVWADAPEEFRQTVLTAARDKCRINPTRLRQIVCGVLRKRPDPDNWSEYPNIWAEVECHVHNCDWYQVYDIVEAIRANLTERAVFDQEINSALRELGIGWQFKDGLIQARGEDTFEAVVKQANETLRASDKVTAQNELQEALKDISRRPVPDVTGGIQHSMAALECIAKDVTEERAATLGRFSENLVQLCHRLWIKPSKRSGGLLRTGLVMCGRGRLWPAKKLTLSSASPPPW